MKGPLGILVISREARGKQSERWFIQDGRANFVKLIPLSKNLNYYKEDLIDSEAPKSRKINSQTLSKGLWKTGFRIVDLEFLLFQLMKGCQNCQKNISLCDIEKETKRGLAYILYIKCNEWKSLIKIYTSRYHTNAEVKLIKVMKEDTTFSTSTLFVLQVSV